MAPCSTEAALKEDYSLNNHNNQHANNNTYGFRGYGAGDEDDSTYLAQPQRMVARRKPSRRASACCSVDYSYRSIMQPVAVAASIANSEISDDSPTPLYNPVAKYASPHSPISVAGNTPDFFAAEKPEIVLELPPRRRHHAASAAGGGHPEYDRDDEVSVLTMQSNLTVEEKKMPARRGKKKPVLENNSTHTNNTSSAVLMEERPLDHNQNEPLPSQDPTSSASCHIVELLPGVYEPLRSAQETWGAIERDFFIPSTCITCQAHIFCIQDSRFVLCPQCRVVSPLHPQDHQASSSPDHSHQGGRGDEPTTQVRGIGLGFTYEQLCDWQGDILRQRQGGSRRGRRMSAVW
eukprot:scaffold4552_cov161-Amphora_coffeaeformis.AAC.6